MCFLLIQLDLVTQISNVAIYSHAHIAGAPHLIKERFICALMLLGAINRAPTGRKQHDTRTFRQFEDRVNYLLDSLLADLAPTLWTVQMTNTGIEQTQVVIYLRHRSDRRTRVQCCPFLADRK